MARPKTKQELTDAAHQGLRDVLVLVDALPCGVCFDLSDVGEERHWARDKNVRDILVHLHEWHKLLLDWVQANHFEAVEPARPFLPEPYNWQNYGEMNEQLWQKHQTTSEETARQLLEQSHGDVMRCLDCFSDDELWARGQLGWVGGSTLGQYFISATIAHYDWACKKLKKARACSQ